MRRECRLRLGLIDLQDQTDVPVGSAPTPGELCNAGIRLRFLAAVVDFLIMAVPFAVFVSFLSVAMGISTDFLKLHPGEPPSELLTKFGPAFLTLSLCFYVLTSWLYFAGCESSRWRATPGKRLLGLYVAGNGDASVGFLQASARYFFGRALDHVPVLGGYFFTVDCLCVAVLPSQRAIHDLASGCFVLRKEGNGRFF